MKINKNKIIKRKCLINDVNMIRGTGFPKNNIETSAAWQRILADIATLLHAWNEEIQPANPNKNIV